MEFRDLKLFLDVAATGSFSRTATLAMTTQSTVSKAITQLESDLGVRLFERTGRGAVLTTAGHDLLPRAEALVADTVRLKGWMSERKGVVAGTVRIAIQPGVSWPLLEAIWQQARADYPDVHLQISEGTTHQVEEWLGDGRSDIGVLSRIPPAAYAQSWPMFSVPLLLVSRAGSDTTRQPAVPFARLADIALVMATTPNGGRVLLEGEAQRRSMPLRIDMEVNSLFLNKRVVASSELCMVATWPSVYVEVARGELAVSRLVDPELRQTYHLAVSARGRPTSAVSCLAAMIRKFAPAADWRALPP